MKLWILPSGSVLIDVVGLTNSVGFVVKNVGLVVSIFFEVWPAIDVSMNEAVTVIFDADVETGAIEVVVSGVSVAKRNNNFSMYHKGIQSEN